MHELRWTRVPLKLHTLLFELVITALASIPFCFNYNTKLKLLTSKEIDHEIWFDAVKSRPKTYGARQIMIHHLWQLNSLIDAEIHHPCPHDRPNNSRRLVGKNAQHERCHFVFLCAALTMHTVMPTCVARAKIALAPNHCLYQVDSPVSFSRAHGWERLTVTRFDDIRNTMCEAAKRCNLRNLSWKFPSNSTRRKYRGFPLGKSDKCE